MTSLTLAYVGLLQTVVGCTHRCRHKCNLFISLHRECLCPAIKQRGHTFNDVQYKLYVICSFLSNAPHSVLTHTQIICLLIHSHRTIVCLFSDHYSCVVGAWRRKKVIILPIPIYTLPFKRLGSLRNVLVFERKAHCFVH